METPGNPRPGASWHTARTPRIFTFTGLPGLRSPGPSPAHQPLRRLLPPMQATPLRVVRLASAATGAGRTCPYRYLTDGTADAGGPGLPPGVPVRQVTGRPGERPPRSEHGGKAWR